MEDYLFHTRILVGDILGDNKIAEDFKTEMRKAITDSVSRIQSSPGTIDTRI